MPQSANLEENKFESTCVSVYKRMTDYRKPISFVLWGVMYLARLSIWNFRKFGTSTSKETDAAGVTIPFNEGMNVLIGENDSGKSAIVDAIRLTLGTQSRDWAYIDESDFHFENGKRAESFKIECQFEGFSTAEAAPFLEWIDIEEIEGEARYSLTLVYSAQRVSDRIIRNLRAGSSADGASLPTAAQDLLRIIYLKPLRDAEQELTSGRKSRLAQILKAHPAFYKEDESKIHPLESIVKTANDKVETYFTDDKGDPKAVALMKTVNDYLSEIFPPSTNCDSCIRISGSALHDILQRLSLLYSGESAGLGSLNLLYIAAELLLLQSSGQQGLSLTVVEELEAHLHPQAQLQLVKFLQAKVCGQLILTTHSTTLASSIKLESLIICKDGKAFPMGTKYTNLSPSNYDFLERFLDATKANLFFAKGVIFVEGDAENIILPTVAEKIGRPLHRYGVSIVNVGSTAFLHYTKIFSRKDGQDMGINVSVVTDLDVKPFEIQKKELKKGGVEKTLDQVEEEKDCKSSQIKQRYDSGRIKTFVSPSWTLEYELARSTLKKYFYKSVLFAEKISNSKTGEPQNGKMDEVIKRCNDDLSKWESVFDHERKNELIAQEIYYNVMLDKNISKAITAQVFAQKLHKRQGRNLDTLADVFKQKHLAYIRDAICHVTEVYDE